MKMLTGIGGGISEDSAEAVQLAVKNAGEALDQFRDTVNIDTSVPISLSHSLAILPNGKWYCSVVLFISAEEL